MERLMHPPGLGDSCAPGRFDPIVEGERLGLSPALSRMVWDRVRSEAGREGGHLPAAQIQRRFRERAARIAAHGGRVRPDVGKMTRVGVELYGESPRVADLAAEEIPTPGRETLAQRARDEGAAVPGPPMSASGGSPVHRTAARGVASAGRPLPHLDVIQRAFGHHDVRGVRAHTDGDAARAARAIGATAYATGDAVAFVGWPDLHTAAHEAAHIIQQRHGVELAGDVGRADDVYERHADRVADVVVAGGHAAALLDQMPGRSAQRASRAVVQRNEGGSGHYQGLAATVQLNRLGATVVGRLQVHRALENTTGSLLHSYSLCAEFQQSALEGDVFIGTARGPHSELSVTIVLMDDAVRVTLGGRAYIARRISDHPAMPSTMLVDLSPLDRATEIAPLTATQEAAVRQLIAVAQTQLREFFERSLWAPPTDASRFGNLIMIDGAVKRLFSLATPEQSAELSVIARARLHSAVARPINGVSWDLLDWLYQAMALYPAADLQPVDAIHRHLHIPVGRAGLGQIVYRYRMSLAEGSRGTPGNPGPGGALYLGLVVVEALEPRPASHVSDARQEHVRWRQSYPMGRIRIRARATLGAEDPLPVRMRTATAVVDTPWPWDRDDFIGPIGGIGCVLGLTANVGGNNRSIAYAPSVLQFFGSGVYPPLDVNFQTDAIPGYAASAGGEAYIEGGELLGITGAGVRDPAAAAELPVGGDAPGAVVVMMAFGTDQCTLSDAGLRGLRQALAWNQALLETGTSRITVDAFTSRLGSDDHNLALATRRQRNVMDAIARMIPGAPLRMGDARGEAAARDLGTPDGDNAAEWRRADIRIDGILVLQLYAAAQESLGFEPEIAADPMHPD